MTRLVLLTRAYCHLCDEMAAALAPLVSAHQAELVLIDVDGHPEFEAEWNDAVPVLFVGMPEPAAELCRHRLDADRVRAALRRDGPARRVARVPEIR